MIRMRRASDGALPRPTAKGDGFRVSEGRPLTVDAGMAVVGLARDAHAGRGGYVAIGGGVSDFAERAAEAIRGLVAKLAALGSPVDRLECALFGGTDTAKWQLDRVEKLLRAQGLTPDRLADTGGKVYRTFTFDVKAGVVEVASEEENAAHWSPAASALGIEDGIRVFRQNAVTGKVANATRFFREKKTFSALQHLIVPEYLASGTRLPLRIWCAACSSGEEPYSYAMLLLRLRDRAGASFPFRIDATDINETLLERAERGAYDVPQRDVDEYGAYFRKYGNLQGQRVDFGPEVRSVVRFRPFDIRNRPRKHRFRLIVCANVFQYYNDEARQHFLRNFAAVAERPGYIYVNNVREEMLRDFQGEYLREYGLVRIA